MDGVDQNMLLGLEASDPSALLLIPSGSSASVGSDDPAVADASSTASSMLHPKSSGPNTTPAEFPSKVNKVRKEVGAFFQ